MPPSTRRISNPDKIRQSPRYHRYHRYHTITPHTPGAAGRPPAPAPPGPRPGRRPAPPRSLRRARSLRGCLPRPAARGRPRCARGSPSSAPRRRRGSARGTRRAAGAPRARAWRLRRWGRSGVSVRLGGLGRFGMGRARGGRVGSKREALLAAGRGGERRGGFRLFCGLLPLLIPAFGDTCLW